ncbi:hypothetical protein BCL69_11332 [Nitrosomonas communis]|uniref:Uncharacterized protein n=1 Tax=Nitrosomonas communis TaxID=44574 RepID=A0A0F7KJQ0_9PROT|nr:hypothetical protein AAW31_17235 [Nitrosomonas communis]TYP69926.1 hypothetical protein BCL69_11332 [Nitrosomonas communis]
MISSLSTAPKQMMENPLSKLALDYLYQVLMVVCFFVFLFTGSGFLSEFPTVPTALMSIGGFFVGLGELINHPLQTRLLPTTANTLGATAKGYPRNNKPTGIVFVLSGLSIAGVGIYKLLS